MINEIFFTKLSYTIDNQNLNPVYSIKFMVRKEDTPTPFQVLVGKYKDPKLAEHFVCEERVAEPVIGVTQVGKGRDLSVVVQCDSVLTEALPPGTQSLFGLDLKPDDPSWQGKPSEYKVVFLGKAKDYESEEAQKMDPNQWVVVAVNPNGEHAHTIISKLNRPADEEVGIVATPMPYILQNPG